MSPSVTLFLLAVCSSLGSWEATAQEETKPPEVRFEKLITKSGGEYLGRTVSAREFRTCEGTKMQVGDGRVEETEDRCPRRESIRYVMEEVTITDVKVADREVTATTVSHPSAKYFYPASAEKIAGSVALDAVKKGDRLRIWTDGEGRIEYVATKKDTPK